MENDCLWGLLSSLVLMKTVCHSSSSSRHLLSPGWVDTVTRMWSLPEQRCETWVVFDDQLTCSISIMHWNPRRDIPWLCSPTLLQGERRDDKLSAQARNAGHPQPLPLLSEICPLGAHKDKDPMLSLWTLSVHAAGSRFCKDLMVPCRRDILQFWFNPAVGLHVFSSDVRSSGFHIA